MNKKLATLFLITVLCLSIILSGCSLLFGEKDTSNEVSITLDLGDGNQSIIKGEIGQPIVLPSSPVREGFKFLGWYYDEEFTTIYTSANYTKNLTLYAKWEALGPFSITYNGNGGVGSTIDSYDLGEKVILPTDWVREGYTFKGWYLEDNFVTHVTEITEDEVGAKEFYAKWEAKTYKISFETNGGSIIEDLYARMDESIKEPEVPSKSGYCFEGWYIDKALTKPFVFDKMPYQGATIYAKWVESFTIQYNEGTALLEEVTYTTNKVTLIDPINYHFNKPESYFFGWYYDEELTQRCDKTITITGDTKLYAKWVRKSFTPYLETFNSKGESNLDPILINNKTEFISFLDYIIFYNNTKGKFIKFTYLDLLGAQNQVKEMMSLITNASMALSHGRIGDCFKISVAYDEKEGYVQKVEDYKTIPGQTKNSKALNEKMFIKNSTRSESFDDFKYKDFAYSMDVENSNQLFYALQYGYRPICKSGSTAESMFNKAKAILRNIIDNDMSDVQKVYQIYSYLVNNVHYDHKAVTYDDLQTSTESNVYDSWHIEGVLNNGIAVCDGIAKTATVLCRIEGITCIRIVGSNHAWNKVYLDLDNNGIYNWYCFDSTWGNTGTTIGNSKFEVLVNNHFLFTDDYVVPNKVRVAGNHLDVKANTKVDQYKQINFTYQNKEYDYVVENRSEVKVLANYIHSILNAPKYSPRNEIILDKNKVCISFKQILTENIDDFGQILLDELMLVNAKSLTDKDVKISYFTNEGAKGVVNFIFEKK